MSASRVPFLALAAGFVLFPAAGWLSGQGIAPAGLPATAPTQVPRGETAPIAAVATPADRFGSTQHPARVQCTGGQLEVVADNSSLNSILRAISRCTGMRITGGVAEQRVFGNYGPAAPATVLATLIDGTGSNMLLRETGADQPAELILTPRVGGATPPPPSSYNDEENAGSAPQQQEPTSGGLQPSQPFPRPPMRPGQTRGIPPEYSNSGPAQNPGSAVTSPQPIPQPFNNVNGSPSNTSPTASTLPTTNSVPLDAVRTPSTTPSVSGIVDAPNPPPAGSDTAAAQSGAPQGTPGTTNINPGATSPTTTPGGTNTTQPATGTPAGTDITPEQIFRQLQQRQQQQQQQQNQNSPQ